MPLTRPGGSIIRLVLRMRPIDTAASAQPAGKVPVDSVRQHLERVLTGETFGSSERLSRFLRFTVEETLQGRGAQIKEYLLGVQVFDRHASYDPRTDPIVRVEAGRLRAKLATYYETEGRDEPVQIEYRKGGYTPAFQLREARPAKAASALRSLAAPKTILLLGATLAACGAILWVVALLRQAGTLKTELAASRRGVPDGELALVWAPFFDPAVETTVVFGSPIFFQSERYRLFLRLPNLNEMAGLEGNAEFRNLRERFGDLVGPRYDYASMADAIALQRITVFFGRGGRELRAVAAHRAAWDSIAGGNIIFLGAQRMNPLLRRLPFRQDFQVGPPDTQIYNLNPKAGEEKIYSTPSHRDALTYAVVATFPGLRPNREIMVLSAHLAAGLSGAVDYVTKLDTVRALAEKLQLSRSGRTHYQLLLRVITDKDEPVKTEYVTHHLGSEQVAGGGSQGR